MASQAQIDACRANGAKSRGPVTPEGRRKSAMNALKHGRRSKRIAILREDSLAVEVRSQKWLVAFDANDDVSEYLIVRNVARSVELDRAARALRECIDSAIEGSDDKEIGDVEAIGKRLFIDPAGNSATYGILPENRSKLKKSSGTGVADPNDPGELVALLESSEMGCVWLRCVWEELRSQLSPKQCWQSIDRFKCIRLLGHQPADGTQDRRVAEIFVASKALDPAGIGEFEDLLSDLTSKQLERYKKRVWARWPDLKSAREPAKAREILIDLCDQQIEELDEKLAEHAENADSNVERTIDRLGVEQSSKAKELRNYWMQCDNRLERGLESYRKYQRQKSKQEGARGDLGEPRSSQSAVPRSVGRRRRVERRTGDAGHELGHDAGGEF